LNAAKKIILLLWLLIVASLGNVSASTPGATENRTWEKSLATTETRQAGPLQTLGGHQENGGAGYDYAVDCLLAAETAAWKPTPFNKCFPAGTLVLMADGSRKAIEDVQEGDEVFAGNPEGDEAPCAHRVIAVHKNWTLRLIHVVVEGQDDSEIRATGEHPFWTQKRGWVMAKDLVAGDQLQDQKGEWHRVFSTKSESITCDTFNLSVDGAHTFYAFAGNTAVLVHNTDPIFPLEVRPYSDFGLYPYDNLVGHEMLQNAWLKANGYIGFKAQNPSLALPTDFHVGEVNPRQAAAGLWDRSTLTGQSAYDNIRANIQVLDDAGVPRDVIAEQARAARNFAKSLPCP
jgi:hypothetical protein